MNDTLPSSAELMVEMAALDEADNFISPVSAASEELLTAIKVSTVNLFMRFWFNVISFANRLP